MVPLKLDRLKVDKIITKLTCIEFLYISTARFPIKIHGSESTNTWKMFQACYLQIYLLYIVLICQISSKVRYDQLFPFVYTQPYI